MCVIRSLHMNVWTDVECVLILENPEKKCIFLICLCIKTYKFLKKYAKYQELEKLKCFKVFVWMPDDGDDDDDGGGDLVWIETCSYIKFCSLWNRVLCDWCIEFYCVWTLYTMVWLRISLEYLNLEIKGFHMKRGMYSTSAWWKVCTHQPNNVEIQAFKNFRVLLQCKMWCEGGGRTKLAHYRVQWWAVVRISVSLWVL